MDRAAGCSRDARRPAQTPERDGQWQQDRVVRRLLLPGRRAHGAPRRRVERAAWPIPSAASAAAAARRPLRSKAAERFRRRHASHTAAMRGRPPPHTSAAASPAGGVGSVGGAGGQHRACIVLALPELPAVARSWGENSWRLQ